MEWTSCTVEQNLGVMIHLTNIKVGDSQSRWVMFDNDVLAPHQTAALEHKYKYDIEY